MSNATFSKDQVAALEKILGVKLPEQGFTLEITPGVSGLDESQLDGVVGGLLPAVAQQMPGDGSVHPVQNQLQLPAMRWSAKI
jgi:hypothetical protein